MFEFNLEGLELSDQKILAALNFKLNPGETHCLLGPSGSGKTSLLNVMAGLKQDNTVTSTKGESKHQHHNQWLPRKPDIGYLFQQPRLLPWRTILQNLQLVEPDKETVLRMLGEVRLQDYADYYPAKISLGMARRVALARCLLLKPELVLMDEPLTSLDPPTAREMRRLIKRLVCDHPTRSMIYVTHNLEEALELGDTVSVLGNTPAEVIYSNSIDNVSREELETLLKHS
ncbi:ABC transporter ATP-binding protein [Neptunomonas qingdaonensis]|uniref:NitT/TauT family transport system ATP-binding protein n=1 Tax=Neptunomonas qingdaonensis TaxID=1045558 RepID=A0A1I2P187_9GAMM|nr:ATP-binding cassette domain-containing protein [Neptunomonas qingdaonensis]SFG09834.1 NitT/TauT family transport system ATP-binding protein [Neptunomonas qingdaonensis]